MANAQLKFDDDLLGETTEVISLEAVEEDFCQLYVATGVAWKAYRDTVAAYLRTSTNENTVRKSASLFLARPHIKARVDQIRRETYQSLEITEGRIIQELGKMAFFDIRKVLDDKGNLKPIHEMDDATAAGIAGIDFSVTKSTVSQDIYDSETEDIGRVDEQRTVTHTAKLKLADKNKALDSLSKLLGMNIDKVEHTGAGGTPLIPDVSETNVARQVAFLLSQGVVAAENSNA